jgi:hypothetical protein
MGQWRCTTIHSWSQHQTEMSNQLHALAALLLGKDLAVLIVWEAGWAPEPVWMLWSREKLLCPFQELNLCHPVHRPSIHQMSYPGSQWELSTLHFRFSHPYSSLPKFKWNFACCLPHTGFFCTVFSMTRKTEAIYSFGKLVDFHQAIWYYITEDRNFYISPTLKKKMKHAWKKWIYANICYVCGIENVSVANAVPYKIWLFQQEAQMQRAREFKSV